MRVIHVLLIIICGLSVYFGYFAFTDNYLIEGYIVDDFGYSHLFDDMVIYRYYKNSDTLFCYNSKCIVNDEKINVCIIKFPEEGKDILVDYDNYVNITSFAHRIHDELFNITSIEDWLNGPPVIMPETLYYDEEGREYKVRCALYSKIKVDL